LVGRFLTPDPLVPNPSHAQSWNAYSYVINNPLSWVDPSGFDEEGPNRGALGPNDITDALRKAVGTDKPVARTSHETPEANRGGPGTGAKPGPGPQTELKVIWAEGQVGDPRIVPVPKKFLEKYPSGTVFIIPMSPFTGDRYSPYSAEGQKNQALLGVV